MAAVLPRAVNSQPRQWDAVDGRSVSRELAALLSRLAIGTLAPPAWRTALRIHPHALTAVDAAVVGLAFGSRASGGSCHLFLKALCCGTVAQQRGPPCWTSLVALS